MTEAEDVPPAVIDLLSLSLFNGLGATINALAANGVIRAVSTRTDSVGIPISAAL